MGILDDYFDGYYSEEMIECQVTNKFCFYLLQFTISSAYNYSPTLPPPPPPPSFVGHINCIVRNIKTILFAILSHQVDQLVLDVLVREKFPKLGMSLVLTFLIQAPFPNFC